MAPETGETTKIQEFKMSNSNGQNSSVNGDSASNRDGTRPPMNGGSAPRNAPTVNAASTLTITETPTPSNGSNDVLPLTLRPRPNVTWDEDVIDNEGLGRKSSKRCCIFHKQRAFGESSTDSSEDDNDNDSDGSSSSGGPSGNSKPIAKKKIGKVSSKKVPDYQRFHA